MTTNIGYEFPDHSGEIESLRQQLAECQAREKVLRDLASEIDATLCRNIHCEKSRFTEALAMPYDSTALDTMKKKWQREALLEAADYFAQHHDIIVGENTLRRMAKELE
jgi:hypothetical protein